MKSVLLIDDSKFSCKREGEMIQNFHSGVDVTLAYLPSDAIRLIRDEGKIFDLIFLDFNMPEMNGLQLLDELKDHVDLAKVILLTATSAFATKSQTLPEGVRLIQKPLSIEKLEATLGKDELQEQAS
ncbi:response regulator [Pseudobacteriovorax antillogorgiicola]|uniref:Response regulator receiver domain-containing protein n=1 Tax=Pseudobacteriovorax antillogorgiicola TaxID=1513793 RepID=A0A1Y6BCT8_9BACT|nr:response regulator [Pseudobacteriovorax antillogorgiicola]TCS56490.1 response regulator receiver domain-containing protein [Pseudobacteriovorax antillogorgiicola]SMF04845.1 Response regulator receiver domain-containing protein [Pseudobacteriovorax antillogorgiicola]